MLRRPRFKPAVVALAACASLAGCATSNIAAPTATHTAKASPQAQQTTSSASPSGTPSQSVSSSASASPSTDTSPIPSASPSVEVPPSADASPTTSTATPANAVPAKQVQQWMNGKSAPSKPTVFLTFDDGPNNTITPQVLDILKKYDVHATFFIVGQQVADHPDVLRRTFREGNAIGLHSWNHNYKQLYPGRCGNEQVILSQFTKTMDAVKGIIGSDFTTGAWRYPGGHMSWKGLDSADKALAAKGAYWIDWNAMTGDAEPSSRRPKTKEAMIAMATTPISAGQKTVVMLAHDAEDKKLTVASLPAIIEAYKAAGYDFATIG